MSASTNDRKPGQTSKQAPGFFRRIAATFYDALLLLAVLFFATAIALPLNAGEAFSSKQYYYPAYLLGISFVFYGWFWTHGGQTLGLRSWKMKLISKNQQSITWKQAFLRFVGAIISWLFLGAGFIWILLDKQNLSWHDYLSDTMPIDTRKH